MGEPFNLDDGLQSPTATGVVEHGAAHQGEADSFKSNADSEPDPWLVLAAALGRAAARAGRAKATSRIDEEPPTTPRQKSRINRP